MTDLSNEALLAAASSPRFAALTQLDINLGDLVAFDPELLRDPRLLVPIDLNAFVVGATPGEATVRLPFRTATDTAPDVRDAGTPRERGVHLLWTTPAALGRGTIVPDAAAPDDPTRSTLSLPALPDRWVVLRLAVPLGASQPLVRGWVLRADDGTVTPLATYPASAAAVQIAEPVDASLFNAQIGGPGWTECYDAALGRLALHDPLDDLDAAAPNGVEGDAISYVVCGWWDRVQHDPLDGVASVDDYHTVLQRLRWDDPDHPAKASDKTRSLGTTRKKRRAFGLGDGARYDTTSAGQSEYRPARSGFAKGARNIAVLRSTPTALTLLHGRLHGVPFRGEGLPDDRPRQGSISVAFGPTSPSVSALIASGAMVDAASSDQQRDAERLLTAFQSGLLSRIDNPDVWPEIEHYEHLQGFGSLPGGVEAVDRLRDDVTRPNDPGSGNRLGRRLNPHLETLVLSEAILWSTEKYGATLTSSAHASSRDAKAPASRRAVEEAPTGPQFRQRNVPRPAVPFTYAVAPVLAISGGGRRIRAAERDEADGVLRVRTADHLEPGPDAMASVRRLLPTIGSGAVPDEVLQVARESIATDPFLADWRAAQTPGDSGYVAAFRARSRSEAALRYAYYAGDLKLLSAATGVPVETSADRQRATEGLIRHVTTGGVWAHPEGVTMWGQPWRPQYCEWTLELHLAGLGELLASTDPQSGSGWSLGEHDLERDSPFADAGADVVTLSGRSPLHTGTADSLAAAVSRWLEEERLRDAKAQGVASLTTEAAMAELAGHLRALDLQSVTLDGVRERLLGLRYDRGLRHDDVDVAPDGTPRALAEALPRLVAAGRVSLLSARLVDSWGRLLELPVASAKVVAHSADPDGPAGQATLALPPRLTIPSRAHLRLVDPVALDATAATAVVDQIDATLMVNPVAGYLLPDHIDEALEMFGPDGSPLGQLAHDAFSDAVFWEGAPGRVDVGPSAGPLDDRTPTHRRMAWIAAGVVTVDATVRQVAPGRPEIESPLSAMLRAIDTTLWSVDPFGSLGTEHIAGLVGRPLAVVTATLTIDVRTDIDELVYASTTSRAAREQAYADLAMVPFAVRLGTLLRSDDGLVGFYVDDDYTKLHVIDRSVAAHARESGRCRGVLASEPGGLVRPLTGHAFIDDSGIVTVRAGQTRRLTMLVHPGGKVHVSSGIAPRSSVALARDWVQPGLRVLAPSVRVGPLLIDADKVRLPMVSSFPADQLFTRRESPGAWRDDPILAATQAAFLPDQPSTFQEGWIRVNPNPGAQTTAATPSTSGGN